MKMKYERKVEVSTRVTTRLSAKPRSMSMASAHPHWHLAIGPGGNE